ncbi:Protein CBG17912 [Caenorhabditis briggsae]|uniref:Protein CBG17912 n=1 Tax=Caenorhabditis briggsae TaxID=6238 RepID=A8XS33_CAEBR|nr:Protein CBG17912 [Caenorhabditis briggsae]CAP35452.2 Protein CBG17912 [Caenorhabditis briggsae]
MGKLEPTWQGIPFEIKEVVLKYLEYKSRFRLRVCSKSDKNLIDNSPVFLKQVELYENPLVLRINNNLEMQENVIAHFLEIFKNKYSKVKSLILDSKQLAKLSLESENTLKTREVYFKTFGMSQQNFVRLFQKIDLKSIKSISFRRNLSEDLIDQLARTDAWKNSLQIFCYGRQDIPMDHVLGRNHFRAQVINLEPVGIWIAEFKEKPEKVRNEQWQFSTEHSCSYIFPVNTKNRIFVLRMRRSGFNGYDIEGYVCTENYTDDEFGKYGSWIPKNHEIVNHRIRRGNFNIVNLANYL